MDDPANDNDPLINHIIPDLHPCFRVKALELQHEMQNRGSPLRIFEGYRSPARQAELYHDRRGVTHAKAWQSPHQYGLAIDFAGWVAGRWTWELDEDWQWDSLATAARQIGLDRPLSWDKGHIVHPAWLHIRRALRAK